MCECENYVEDFKDVFINGHHDTEDCSFCCITKEKCAKDDCWSICPMEED